MTDTQRSPGLENADYLLAWSPGESSGGLSMRLMGIRRLWPKQNR